MLRYRFKKKTHCLRGHLRTPENVSPGRYCKTCQAIWNKKHKRPSDNINAARSNKLGWTKQLYNSTKKKHKNKCAICRLKFKYSDYNTNACRDHKHSKPPKPRGLLCHNCNLMLGNAKESIKTLKAAVKYLRKWDASFSMVAG